MCCPPCPTLPLPCRALLRCHPPPNMHKMVELSTTAAELGFHLDTSGAGKTSSFKRLLLVVSFAWVGLEAVLHAGLS